jgi:hypothetical protein
MASVRSSERSAGRSLRPARPATQEVGSSPTHGLARFAQSAVISDSGRCAFFGLVSRQAARWRTPSSLPVSGRPRRASASVALLAITSSMAWVRRENSVTKSGATPSISRLATRPAMAGISFHATPERSVIRSSTMPVWRSERATTQGWRALLSRVHQATPDLDQ